MCPTSLNTPSFSISASAVSYSLGTYSNPSSNMVMFVVIMSSYTYIIIFLSILTHDSDSLSSAPLGSKDAHFSAYQFLLSSTLNVFCSCGHMVNCPSLSQVFQLIKLFSDFHLCIKEWQILIFSISWDQGKHFDILQFFTDL